MSDWKQPFVSGSGLCYPSTDYANVNNKLTGGNKVNPDGIISTSFGGSKKKVVQKNNKKKQKGGEPLYHIEGPYPPEASLTGTPGEVLNFQEGPRLAPVSDSNSKQCGGKKQKKVVNTKDKKKQQKGGQSLYQSEGSYPSEASLTGTPGEVLNFQEGPRLAPVSDSNSKQSGGKKQNKVVNTKDKKKQQKGGQSLYQSEGPYPPEASLTGTTGEVLNFQEGPRLAPVSDSNSKQCGGKKQKKVVNTKDKKKQQKGGQTLYQSEGPYPPEASLLEKSGEVLNFQEGPRLALFSDAKQNGGKKQKKVVNKEQKKKQKGGTECGQTPMPPQWYDPNIKLQNYPSPEGIRDIGIGNLVPSFKGGKKMRGGMESPGATYAHPAFFDSNIKLKYFPSPEGIRNVGTVDLVPNMPGNTLGNVMKTGGSKLKKNFKKGGELIPRVGDPAPAIRDTIDGAIDQFSNFMRELDQSYLNSVKYFSGLKFGGKKKNKKEQEQQKEQRQKLRLQEKKQQKNKRQKGGDGSDFALTLSSRGPVNAPDAYWGVDGEKWFRQFNKSGDYIPNSQLAKAATPLLAGDNPCNIVVGFDEMGNDYGKV